MISSQCQTPSNFLHQSADFSAFNTIHHRKFHVFAAPIKEKHNLYGHTSATTLQFEDFLQTVTTSPKQLAKVNRYGEIRTIAEFNRLLVSLISSDEVELAWKLKSTLSSLGLFPDVRTYSILVNGFCKNKAMMIEARITLHEMLENGFEPNVATFTTVIYSFCESGRLKDAYEVFDEMSKIGCEPTVNTYNCLLKGLCYVGRIEEAYDVIKRRSDEAFELLVEALRMKLTPSVVTYNTLFNGYFKEGKPLLGFGLLRRMRARKCSPDYISYSTLLHGMLKWGKIRAAMQVYKEMVGDGFRADEGMMNTLLRGLCRRARKEKYVLDDAYNVFEEMRDGRYVIYQESYELVVEAMCCNGRDMERRGFEVLNEMIGIGFSPKTFTFNIAIHALCCCGEVDKALAVLAMMHKHRKARGIPFNALIDELILQGRVLEAACVYGFALKKGVVPKWKPQLRTCSIS
ncbi:hypothetical protein SASPL_105308 [Salvia splendens]|uniref:PROP1-like PPR domain-containing protein n=1 Tax=Salvia splendens TaxID=180675 RepID=A0A8X9A9V6_SALSN|nr:hypothetical protein SASPL_105308 [Salvia splendens]